MFSAPLATKHKARIGFPSGLFIGSKSQERPLTLALSPGMAGGEGIRHHRKPVSARAITSRWISLVPS